MIPSAVASEVTGALRDFLATGFGPSNPELANVVDDFLNVPENLVKGPYLSIALPFRRAPEGGEPFPEIPLGFTPYRHQRNAFSRLAANAGHSTIVATGTGSGKTECFLYPILDCCRQQAGKPGVKAILIYPMNALAIDQARRIAEIIHDMPALRGKVTAGLYVGGAEKSPHTSMGRDHVITKRDTLRERPPDILLTNYRMLDFLMIRPADQRLWRYNEPGALRYLVVDELHTFDGAQGTDLACLIRRLRARLKVPGGGRQPGSASGAQSRENGLICVGTSATLGESNSEQLLDYVSMIFDQHFEPGSVVGEVRQTIDEFFGDALIRMHLAPHDDLAERVDPMRYDSMESYVRAQHEVFFGVPLQGEFKENAWRFAAARKLREHLTFVNLLRALQSRPTAIGELVERLRPSLPVANDREAARVLNGLCALISAARSRPDGDDGEKVGPFLQVGLHVWVRELRRMVCSVREPLAAEATDEESQDITRRLRHSDDLKPDEASIHLPLIQCRECHVTGWGAVQRPTERRIEQDLALFYNRFFLRDVDVKFYFPAHAPPNVNGYEVRLCAACGHVHAGENVRACVGCGDRRLVAAFCPHAVTTSRERPQLSRDCPFCGAREALIIFGARASSLLSVALGQTFASRHNDDPKVIAFSDNVQDAAHRAGFFAARTWQNSLRAAIAQVVAENDQIPLSELAERVVAWWSDRRVNPDAFDAERFVSEFIAPDRQWLRGFRDLQRRGRLPPNSNLLELVRQRMRWDVLAELGYRSAIGRTLERTRSVALGIDQQALKEACQIAVAHIHEEFEQFREVELNVVRALILGLLRRMKDRGAIHSELVRPYVSSGGNPWMLGRGRYLALQEVGPRSPVPVFPGAHAANRGIELLARQGRGPRSWYQRWVEKVFALMDPLAATEYSADLLALAFSSLESAGLIVRMEAGETHAWGLDAGRFYATSRIAVARGRVSGHSLVLAMEEADLWSGVPCLELGAQDSYGPGVEETPTWFGRLYRETSVRRIVAAEHTALIEREERDRLQERFASPQSEPWEPNLLSATPTLELGIDIGDLSTVMLCSVPPAPENYLQRIGRAGRRDGNAFSVTIATGQSHDLFFYADPLDMLASWVTPPGVFMNASAVLERQLTAFCLDNWVASGVAEDAVPGTIRSILDNVEAGKLDGFPYPFFGFVQRASTELLDGFFAAFANDLATASREYLSEFLQGDPIDRAPLAVRVLNRFLEVAKERKSIRAEVSALARGIKRLKAGPQDEATAAEIDELTLERGGLQRILRELNGRNTFQFLTDEGLIPNYAFPEAGVTLRSVIYRRREQDEKGQGDYEHDIYEYQRPAVSALSELAPENEFYAGSRHVSISRIDTRISEIETWRLCPSCAYCEKLVRDEHAACPRCGDPMWADEGQRRNMLPLRLVYAATPDRRSRIIDDKDDREPLFYTRHLVADFDPSLVKNAFALSNPDIPFGFEYVASATFREMNFGRLDDAGQPTSFAGLQMPRRGFRICRFCGTVQRRNADASDHTRNCRARSDESGDSIVDCLYLYREFCSEAVRMLLPLADVLGSEQRTASFIAALELGLRRKFGGALDHIRAMSGDNSLAGPNEGRRYLMLYDTVPGGTGYLKDLMTEPAKLLDVFKIALAALRACDCNRDPLKDGCYRCVYAYRRSRDMERTSRSTAIEILAAILEHGRDLERVESLDKVEVSALLESELEARFIEALRRIEIDGDKLKIRHDLVQGKPGYVLNFRRKTYYLEPQANLGELDGVIAPSRPDFLIRPARSTQTAPIAVFMDGFEYHRDATDQDSVKRMALARSGFLVWSLTWRDLEIAFGKSPDAVDFLQRRSDGMARLQSALDTKWGTSTTRSSIRESSLPMLLRYLAAPNSEKWKQAVFTTLLGLFDQQRMQTPELRLRFKDVAATLPGAVQEVLEELPEPLALAGSGSWIETAPAFADLLVALPLAAVKNAEPDAAMAIIHLHDDETTRQDPDYRRVWNGVLRLFNTLQFLPGVWWTTRIGVEHGVYPEYAPADESRQHTLNEWEEVANLTVPDLREAINVWALSGLPVPEIGYELASISGRVLAEAEVAWLEAKVALLLQSQNDGAPAFQEAGWRTFTVDAETITELVVQALGSKRR